MLPIWPHFFYDRLDNKLIPVFAGHDSDVFAVVHSLPDDVEDFNAEVQTLSGIGNSSIVENVPVKNGLMVK